MSTITAAELAAKDFPEIKWAVRDLIPQGLTGLIGAPKLGKSWMALNIAVAVALGGRALGSIPVEAGPVLYLALEDNQRRLRSRLDKLLPHGKFPDTLHFATEWARLGQHDGGGKLLHQWLNEHPGTRLVIIDTLAKFRKMAGNGNAYQEDYETGSNLKHLADRHDTAFLAVHHKRKVQTEDPLDSISGTHGLAGSFDGMLILQRERGQADAVLHVIGRDIEHDGDKALRWDSTLASWSLLGDAALYRRSQEQVGVIETLRAASEPLSIKQIAARTATSYPTARQLIYRMEGDGVIERAGGSSHGGYVYTHITSITGV